MHDRPPFIPFDDEEEGWPSGLRRLPQPDASEPPRFRASPADGDYPCPQCESPRTVQRHIARRIFGAVGAAAGVTSTIAAALSGAEAGAVFGVIGGPIGAVCGSIAGAILVGLVAGAAGCATMAAALGEALDQKVLDNWRCLACGRTFTVHSD